MAEGGLRKVVEMFDPFGREVSDPSQASRIITSFYDSEGRLVRRVLGKAVIIAMGGGTSGTPGGSGPPTEQSGNHW